MVVVFAQNGGGRYIATNEEDYMYPHVGEAVRKNDVVEKGKGFIFGSIQKRNHLNPSCHEYESYLLLLLLLNPRTVGQ